MVPWIKKNQLVQDLPEFDLSLLPEEVEVQSSVDRVHFTLDEIIDTEFDESFLNFCVNNPSEEDIEELLLAELDESVVPGPSFTSSLNISTDVLKTPVASSSLAMSISPTFPTNLIDKKMLKGRMMLLTS